MDFQLELVICSNDKYFGQQLSIHPLSSTILERPIVNKSKDVVMGISCT